MFDDAETELALRARKAGLIGGRIPAGTEGPAEAQVQVQEPALAQAQTQAQAEREDDEYLYDAEEARICLRCPKERCPLDRNKACVRYRRALRALRRRRASAAAAEGGA